MDSRYVDKAAAEAATDHNRKFCLYAQMWLGLTRGHIEHQDDSRVWHSICISHCNVEANQSQMKVPTIQAKSKGRMTL